MEQSIVEVIAQYGLLGGLLFALVSWLGKSYLPEQARAHREDLERILAAHDRNTARMVDALERNSRVLQYNSQALLLLSAGRGLSADEAAQLSAQIGQSTLGPDSAAA